MITHLVESRLCFIFIFESIHRDSETNYACNWKYWNFLVVNFKHWFFEAKDVELDNSAKTYWYPGNDRQTWFQKGLVEAKFWTVVDPYEWEIKSHRSTNKNWNLIVKKYFLFFDNQGSFKYNNTKLYLPTLWSMFWRCWKSSSFDLSHRFPAGIFWSKLLNL